MVVQDPPLELTEEAPDEFDTNTFYPYTQRGRFTEYVVWPALFRYKNGPVLAKGVAQGCDRTFKAQSLGRSGKVQMIGTLTAPGFDVRPVIKNSTFRSLDSHDIVIHVYLNFNNIRRLLP